MSFQKIKNLGTLTSKYNHNFRKVSVLNADYTKEHLNDVIKPMGRNEDGTEKTYVQAWNDRLKSLPYYQDHSPRKNAVLAVEVVTTFTKDSDVDLKKWKQKNLEWLEKTFSKAPDGKSNVLSMVYHADETGNVHCHAVIIPIDEKGKLNAREFLGGARKLADMQTDYANNMKEFGLSRGLHGSVARHKDIQRYYAELNQNIEYPSMKEGESFGDYFERVSDFFKTRGATEFKRINEEYRNELIKITAEKNRAMEAINHDLKILQAAELEMLQAENQSMEKIQERERLAKKNLYYLEEERNKLSAEMTSMEFSIQKAGDVLEKAHKYDVMQQNMAVLKETDPERYERVRKDIDELMFEVDETDIEIDFALDEKSR